MVRYRIDTPEIYNDIQFLADYSDDDNIKGSYTLIIKNNNAATTAQVTAIVTCLKVQ